MWSGIFPAVTTKFDFDGKLDAVEMERCLAQQIDADVDGLIVCGSLGENMTLEPDEKLQVLNIALSVAGNRPVLMTVCESSTRRACDAARSAAAAGASGLMILPGVPYKSSPNETLNHIQKVATAASLPVMVYNNPVTYGVDVTLPMFEALAGNDLVVAMKESSDDVRRITDVKNAFGDRFAIFTGVDNLALESLLLGADGWVAGLVTAFPRETVAVYRLAKAGRYDEARAIYRWFRPLLDLDVSANLVQNIKLAETLAIGSNDRVREPRLPLEGRERERVSAIIRQAMETRPDLPVC